MYELEIKVTKSKFKYESYDDICEDIKILLELGVKKEEIVVYKNGEILNIKISYSIEFI